MKHLILQVIVIVFSIFVTSCSNEGNIVSLEKERDSLQSVNAQQQMILDNMTAAMANISMSLDTIAIHESAIIKRVDEKGNPLSKADLKERINILSEIIKNQRAKMAAMEKDMTEGKSSITQLKSIIAFLNASLEQKENEIQLLKNELNSKNLKIRSLNNYVVSLIDTVDSVRNKNEEQQQQLNEQNIKHEVAINEVFYIIGTKEQLINYGVISKSGFLKKSKINFASIDKSVLTKADKRTLTTITINGKSPKILSDEPNGSYKLDKGSSSSTLTILDIEKFWNTNNRILVIQIK